MFGGDLNPHYFQNPSGFIYLVHLALRFRLGEGWPFGGFDDVEAQYAADPTDIYLTARFVAVVLAMLGVAGVFWVGRRLWGAAEGLVAAAVMAFAFLPVAYSRYALTDVGVFLPVAVTLLGIVMVHEDGRRRWYVVAGLGLGFTVGFKYTAGLILVPLLLAAALRGRFDRGAMSGTAIALGAAILAFLVTTPYFLLDLGEAIDQLRSQRYAAGVTKAGQADENPYAFYVTSLTWALGWGAALAAAAGLVWELRRNPMRGFLLALFPLLLFLYLANDAERWFARWLLPAYPVFALLAGVAVAGVARALVRSPVARAAVLGVLIAAIVAQPLAAGIRTGTVLRGEDTREEARRFMLAEIPHGTHVVVEPTIRRAYDLPWLGLPDPSAGERFVTRFGAPPRTPGYPPDPERVVRYIDALEPRLVDRYREAGHCVVVTYRWLRERAGIAGLEDAAEYYRRLERESEVIFRTDPYREGEGPVEFDFDLSMHLYHPSEFERTGPEVVIYRLGGCEDRGARRTG